MQSYIQIYLPDFYIIGAPRCGTTSIKMYLSKSEFILFEDKAESIFLNYTANRNYTFKKQKDKIVGVHNPAFLYDKNVPAKIKNVNPDSKFIVILRDPIERAKSHYLLKLRKGEEFLSFKNAIKREHYFEKYNLPFKKYLSYPYLGIGSYNKQLTYYYNYFDKKDFHFISYKKFKQDNQAVVADILKFLGIYDPDVTNQKYKIYNATYSSSTTVRSKCVSIVIYFIRFPIYLFYVLLPFNKVRSFLLMIYNRISCIMKKKNIKIGKLSFDLDNKSEYIINNYFGNKRQKLKI